MPTDEDKIAFTGQKVGDRWEENWWAAGLEEVRGVMEATGYPEEHVHFIPGDVAKTLRPEGSVLPQEIALLRLDTDWYESTRLELEVLYPLLVSLGVLIIDDYGHFEGARKAVDEYWARLRPKPLLQRIDYTGRLVIKP